LGGPGPFALDSFHHKLRKREEVQDWASAGSFR
jgi:hypothetical protein